MGGDEGPEGPELGFDQDDLLKLELKANGADGVVREMAKAMAVDQEPPRSG